MPRAVPRSFALVSGLRGQSWGRWGRFALISASSSPPAPLHPPHPPKVSRNCPNCPEQGVTPALTCEKGWGTLRGTSAPSPRAMHGYVERHRGLLA